jgi:hypothetical protein
MDLSKRLLAFASALFDAYFELCVRLCELGRALGNACSGPATIGRTASSPLLGAPFTCSGIMTRVWLTNCLIWNGAAASGVKA